MKKTLVTNVALVLASLFAAMMIAESAAQFYVYHIAKRGKLFKVDDVLGWDVLPDLDMERKNADGDLWRITTDSDGLRNIPASERAMHRLLIAGDSFAFGEGVDVSERFDAYIDSRIGGLGYTITNTGVMGYGTYQQILKAGRFFDDLGQGDVFLLLTFYNDFLDLLRSRHSGRAKPTITLVGDTLEPFHPDISFGEWLRDKSYVYATVSTTLAHDEPMQSHQIVHVMEVYRALVSTTARQLYDDGTHTYIALHGLENIRADIAKRKLEAMLDGLCAERAITCVRLDPVLAAECKACFLADQHWSREGHRVVGQHLADILNFKLRHRQQ